MADNRGSHPSQKRYPPELRERAVRMVFETIQQTGERHGVITRVAEQLGSRQTPSGDINCSRPLTGTVRFR